MLQRLPSWLAAGLTSGLVILAGFWLIAVIFLNTNIREQHSAVDQKLTAAIIEASINNPQAQTALKTLLINYLKSPEGKAQMTEIIKAPEMTSALAETMQSPEMQSAIINLLSKPEFKNAVLKTIRDTPEMQKLLLLSSAITVNPPEQSQSAAAKR
ncbi:MAG: hypothetical protein H6Q73_3341 [Firmicutes bacterium]|nr:hypothetical protein [Bacillota bacterium]